MAKAKYTRGELIISTEGIGFFNGFCGCGCGAIRVDRWRSGLEGYRGYTRKPTRSQVKTLFIQKKLNKSEILAWQKTSGESLQEDFIYFQEQK